MLSPPVFKHSVVNNAGRLFTKKKSSQCNKVEVAALGYPTLRPTLEVFNCKNKQVETFLYDTGAAISVVPSQTINALRASNMILHSEVPGSCTAIGTAGSETLRIIAVHSARVHLHDDANPICLKLHEVPGIATPILGMDAIQEYNLIHDPHQRRVFRHSPRPHVSSIATTKHGIYLRPLKDISVEPTTGRLIKFGLVDEHGTRLKHELQGMAEVGLLMVAFSTNEEGVTEFHVPNAGHTNLIVKKKNFTFLSVI